MREGRNEFQFQNPLHLPVLMSVPTSLTSKGLFPPLQGTCFFSTMPLRSDLGLAQTWGPKSVSWVGGQLYSERDSAEFES